MRWLPIAVLVLGVAACGTESGDEDATGGDLTLLDTSFPDTDAVAPEVVEDAVVADVPADAGPDVPCSQVESPQGFRDKCDGTVIDTKTGKLWQKGYLWAATRAQAALRCELLSLGDASIYWRLPEIDELRELVRGCPTSEAGGNCLVSKTCYQETCDSEICDGCGMNQGPGQNGCYHDGAFETPCNLFWSNTQVPKKFTGDDRSWYLTFYNAEIAFPPTNLDGSFQVRCVAP